VISVTIFTGMNVEDMIPLIMLLKTAETSLLEEEGVRAEYALRISAISPGYYLELM